MFGKWKPIQQKIVGENKIYNFVKVKQWGIFNLEIFILKILIFIFETKMKFFSDFLAKTIAYNFIDMIWYFREMWELANLNERLWFETLISEVNSETLVGAFIN